MKREPRKIDDGSVRRATIIASGMKQDTLESAALLQSDRDQVKRLAEQLCETCYYLRKGGIAGAAITTQPCGICHIDQIYSSTATHALCQPCALKHELCKQCGADIELRHARKLDLDTEPA